MPEYDRSWFYSGSDYTADGETRGARYLAAAVAAHDYARQLEAGGLNWVQVQYLWL